MSTTSLLSAEEVDQYALVGTAVPIVYQHVDYNGEPATPTTTPTVAAVDGDGVAVTVGAVSPVTGETGRYTATIDAANSTDITELTATWTADGVTHTTTTATIGAWPFSLKELRTSDKSLDGRDTAKLLDARRVTLSEIVGLTGRSPVEMWAKTRIERPTSDLIPLPHRDVRSVLSATDVDSDGTTTAWTAAELAYVRAEKSGLVRIRGGSSWRCDIDLTYRFGIDMPPRYLRDAMMTRCAWWVNNEASNLHNRVTSWSTGEGGTYRYDMAGPMKTGIPDVDAAYTRFRGAMVGAA